jgi:hypothetical protein
MTASDDVETARLRSAPLDYAVRKDSKLTNRNAVAASSAADSVTMGARIGVIGLR